MDDQLTQIADTAGRLATAAEALDRVLGRLEAQQETLGTRIERIVAAIDENAERSGETRNPELTARVAELERENSELKAQAARSLRKTLPPLVSTLLGKNFDDGAQLDSAALDKALAPLSLEQRIAVKAEMARAGVIA